MSDQVNAVQNDMPEMKIQTGANSSTSYESDNEALEKIVRAWATLEKARREAWHDGPGEAETLAWWRSKQASQGIGPSPDDVDDWIRQEKVRRQQWLHGPTKWEKLAYRQSLKLNFLDPRTSRFEASRFTQRLRRRLALASETLPMDEEVEEWERNERSRRQGWINGPSEEELNAYREHVKRESLTFPPDSSPNLDQRLMRHLQRGLSLSNVLIREFPSLYTQLIKKTGEVYSRVRPRIRDHY